MENVAPFWVQFELDLHYKRASKALTEYNFFNEIANCKVMSSHGLINFLKFKR